MPKIKRYPKRKPQPRIEPRHACFSIKDQDVLGIEFDAKFRGQDVYSRLFYVPKSDRLYLWKTDRRPEKFVKVSITCISPKRRDSLLEVWQRQPSEELTTA